MTFPMQTNVVYPVYDSDTAKGTPRDWNVMWPLVNKATRPILEGLYYPQVRLSEISDVYLFLQNRMSRVMSPLILGETYAHEQHWHRITVQNLLPENGPFDDDTY